MILSSLHHIIARSVRIIDRGCAWLVIIIDLVDLGELDLVFFVHLLLTRELNHAWLGAKHDEYQKDCNINESLVGTILSLQGRSVNWHLFRGGLGVIAESENGRDHNVDDVLDLPVCVLTIANLFFYTLIILEGYFEITGKHVGSLEPFREDEDVHPTEQKEEHEESCENLGDELEPHPSINHVCSFHDDTN